MGLITRDQLALYASSKLLAGNAQAHIKHSATEGIPVFLSHSHHDIDIVLSARYFLANQGADVYIDWMDSGMPDICNHITAQLIKEKISKCNKFVILSTKNSLDSVWVPWELGCADGKKGIENIAILPVAENNGRYIGNEYLSIYPYIWRAPDASSMVTSDWSKEIISLPQWLRR